MDPVIKYIQQSFPDFYTEVIAYYKTVHKIQKEAVSNQVISTYLVKESLTNFKSGWLKLCNIIDEFSDVNPPPHLIEITNKFKVIQSTLDLINKSNWRQKKPSAVVEKSVDNIQALAEHLSETITELFSQPTFPHFDTDLCTSFKNDVKSFVGVVLNAFSNDFLGSGQRISDLTKIKTNILSDSNDIISILSAGFCFTDEMKELQKIKNSINDKLDPIISQVSQPFSVVKPSVPPVPVLKSQTVASSRKLTRVASTKQVALELFPRIDKFLNNVLPVLVPGIKLSTDIFENLEMLEDTLKGMQFQIKNLTRKLKQAEHEKEALNEQLLEDENLHANSIEAFEIRMKAREEENKNLFQKKKELEHQIDELQTSIEGKDKEIYDLKLRGDPSILRRGIASILDMDHVDNNNDTGLIITLNTYIKKISKCENCVKKDKRLEKIDTLVSDILHERRNIPTEEKIEAVKQEHNQLIENLKEKERSEIELNNMIRSAYFQIHKNAVTQEKSVTEYLDEIIKKSLRKPAIQQQVHVTKPYADDLKNIYRDFCQVTGADAEAQLQFCLSEDHDTVFTQVAGLISSQILDIRRKLKAQDDKIVDLTKELEKERNKHETFITSLGSEFQVDPSEEMIPKCVETAKSWTTPYEMKSQRSLESQKIAEARINALYTRLRGIIHDKSPVIQGYEEKFDAIHGMLDNIQDTLEDLQSKQGGKKKLKKKNSDSNLFDEWKPDIDIPDNEEDSDDEKEAPEKEEK